MKRSLPWTIAALTALIVSGLGGLAGKTASAARWDETYFPNLPVVTHEGKTVNFYDDLVKGKIVVINFIYTNCPDICSLSTSRMALVEERLGERLGHDIFIYSMTLDPENDTPEVLKEYADAFGVRKGWTFLTGKPKDIHLIRYKLGERSRKLSEHRSDMVLGNDMTGEWRRISLMGNLEIVSQRILEMDPATRALKRPFSKASMSRKPGDYVIENHPGESLYLKACASCHTIGKGKRVGPDLMGVTDRRDRDWLVRYLIAPDVLRAKRDPIVVAVDAQYPGVKMPNLGLSKVDAEDVLVYLETQSNRLSGEPEPLVGEIAHDHSTHDHTQRQ